MFAGEQATTGGAAVARNNPDASELPGKRSNEQVVHLLYRTVRITTHLCSIEMSALADTRLSLTYPGHSAMLNAQVWLAGPWTCVRNLASHQDGSSAPTGSAESPKSLKKRDRRRIFARPETQ
jgi:hypothetical protein